MPYYQIRRLRDKAYRITSKENVFMDLFVGTHHALLWDTGYGFGDLPAAIREVTDLPLIVVNSHGHPDHACGNHHFPAPIYIHPADMALCMQYNSPESRANAPIGAKSFFNWELQREVSLLPAGLDEAAYRSAPSPALSPVEEGHIFDLGGLQLETVHLPGHTAGSIGLLWREEKLLYVGDAIAGFLFLFLPESVGLATYKDTLAKAACLPFDHMVPGHGFELIPRAMLEKFRAAAYTLDYSKGFPFEAMPGMAQVPGTRVCLSRGCTMEDFGKADFTAIVIDPSHMD